MTVLPDLTVRDTCSPDRCRVLVLFGSAEEEARVGDWLEQSLLDDDWIVEQDLGLLRSKSDMRRLRYQVAHAGDCSRRILFLRNAHSASCRSLGRIRNALARGTLNSHLEMITMISRGASSAPIERMEAEFTPDLVVRIDADRTPVLE